VNGIHLFQPEFELNRELFALPHEKHAAQLLNHQLQVFDLLRMGSMPRFCNCTSIKSDSHRHRRLPGAIRSSPVNALQQHRQLSATQRHRTARGLRPDEASAFQSLLK
jgi:hypothetical protein